MIQQPCTSFIWVKWGMVDQDSIYHPNSPHTITEVSHNLKPMKYDKTFDNHSATTEHCLEMSAGEECSGLPPCRCRLLGVNGSTILAGHGCQLKLMLAIHGRVLAIQDYSPQSHPTQIKDGPLLGWGWGLKLLTPALTPHLLLLIIATFLLFPSRTFVSWQLSTLGIWSRSFPCQTAFH